MRTESVETPTVQSIALDENQRQFVESLPLNDTPVVDPFPENKINKGAISSERKGSRDSYGDMEVLVINDALKSVVLLRKAGKETILEQSLSGGNDDDVQRLNYAHPQFSPYGTYLTYEAMGYESGMIRVFNVKTLTDINLPDQYPDVHYSHHLFFTTDEQYLVACSQSGSQSGPGGWIFSTADFSNVFDLSSYLDEYTSVKCMLENNTIVFELLQSTSSEDKEVIFSLETRKAQI